MSIGMTISDLETGESVLEPVSVQDVYSRIWLRGSEVLGLKLIPSFDGPRGCGVVITQDNVSELEQEFESLKNWLQSQDEAPYPYGFFQRRIGFLKASAQQRWDIEKRSVLDRISHLRQVLESLKHKGRPFKLDIG